MLTTQQALASFDIRNFVDQLEPAKRKINTFAQFAVGIT